MYSINIEGGNKKILVVGIQLKIILVRASVSVLQSNNEQLYPKCSISSYN
jgi:hypothetical protein